MLTQVPRWEAAWKIGSDKIRNFQSTICPGMILIFTLLAQRSKGLGTDPYESSASSLVRVLR